MATLYTVKIVSYWVNHHPKDLQKIIEKALSDDTNEIKVEVTKDK